MPAIFTGVFALLTLATARSRGKALAALGVSALLVGAAGWAGFEVGRRYIDDALNRTRATSARLPTSWSTRPKSACTNG